MNKKKIHLTNYETHSITPNIKRNLNNKTITRRQSHGTSNRFLYIYARPNEMRRWLMTTTAVAQAEQEQEKKEKEQKQHICYVNISWLHQHTRKIGQAFKVSRWQIVH